MHILIHSIFGTRKGTNISVLNSFPSRPPSLLLVPLWLPSLPSLAPHCHCHPTWAEDAPAGLGLARVLVAALGPCLGFLPSLSSSVPHDPSGAAWRRGSGQPGLQGTSRAWGPGRPSPGVGTGPGTCSQPFPSRGSSPGGVSPPPHIFGQLQQRSLCLRPQSLLSRLCVCKRVTV